MAKIGTLVSPTTGFLSAEQLAANNVVIAAALANTISRDGSTPNTMSADLDLNNNNILNAGIQYVSYTVATAPSASGVAGTVIYVTDGNAGSACLGVSNGTDWKVISLGATIAAS